MGAAEGKEDRVSASASLRALEALVFGVLTAACASVAVILIGLGVRAIFGPKPAFPGGPNDWTAFLVAGLAMIAGVVAFLMGAVYWFIRSRGTSSAPRSTAGHASQQTSTGREE